MGTTVGVLGGGGGVLFYRAETPLPPPPPDMPSSQPIDIPDAKKRPKKKKRCRATDSFSGRFEGEGGWVGVGVYGEVPTVTPLSRGPPCPPPRCVPAAGGGAGGRGPRPSAVLCQPHHQQGVRRQGALPRPHSCPITPQPPHGHAGK